MQLYTSMCSSIQVCAALYTHRGMSLSLTHMWSRSNCSLKMSGEHSKLDQLWVTNDACTGICICILWPCKAVETIYTIKIVAKHSVTLIKEKTIQIKKTMSVQNENYRKHKLPTKKSWDARNNTKYVIHVHILQKLEKFLSKPKIYVTFRFIVNSKSYLLLMCKCMVGLQDHHCKVLLI